MNPVLREARLALRPMREPDVAPVSAVEREAYQHPWSESIFSDCLQAGYSCWVAENGGGIVGHGVLSVVLDECHVLNVCVLPSRQGCGIGREILRHLLGIGRLRAATRVFLEVRSSNAPAIGLYRSEGFDAIGIRRGYYPHSDGREDALIMAKDLV